MKYINKTLFVWLLAAMLAPAAGYAGQTAQTADTDAPKPERVRRPYRGLFGAPATADSKQSLELTRKTQGEMPVSWGEVVAVPIAARLPS